MITGFNTDIPFEGITYHVQTEDKGLDSPLILSLVYVGGAIIASKRTPYDDLVSSGYDEKVLTERLQRQHKLICAAIRAGRVEELKRMGGQNGAAESEQEAKGEHDAPNDGKAAGRRKKKPDIDASVEQNITASVEQNAAAPTTPIEQNTVAPVEQNGHVKVESVEQASAGSAKPSEEGVVILTTMMDEISALGDVQNTPPVAFSPTPPLHSPSEELQRDDEEEETFVPPQHAAAAAAPQQPVEVYEAVEEDSAGLYLSLLDDEGDFRAGQLATIKIHVGRGAFGRRPVPEASVTVKVLGTTFRPLIQAAATDGLGVAVVRALLPRFTSGRAAIIIRATVGDDAVEMRRIIHQS